MVKDNQEIVNTLLSVQSAQSVKIQNIQEDCQEIKACLLGNGKLGLVVRTDRLEQKDKFRAKTFWVCMGLITTLCIKTVAGLFNYPR